MAHGRGTTEVDDADLGIVIVRQRNHAARRHDVVVDVEWVGGDRRAAGLGRTDLHRTIDTVGRTGDRRKDFEEEGKPHPAAPRVADPALPTRGEVSAALRWLREHAACADEPQLVREADQERVLL